MTVAVMLLLASTAVIVAGPPCLNALCRRVTATLGLTAWMSTLVGAVLLALSAPLVLLWPEHAPAERVIEIALSCLTTVQHAAQPWVGEGAAAISAAVTTAALVRLTRVAHTHLRARSRLRDRHQEMIALVAKGEGGPDDVRWLDHPLPLAYSIDGKPGMIIATRGLREQLDAGQQHAVLAHERAHLRGRHHTIVNLCEILACAFPFLPLFTAAPIATRLLVEYAADRTAAGRTSTATVRSALETVVRADPVRPSWALGLMNEATASRIARLNDPPHRHRRSSTGAFALVAILPVAVPALVSVLSLSALSVLFCTVF